MWPSSKRPGHKSCFGFGQPSKKTRLAAARAILPSQNWRFPTPIDSMLIFMLFRHWSWTLPCANVVPARLHVQSMFLVMNSVGADLVNATLSCDVPNHQAAILGPHGEMNLSQNIMQAGFNLGATQLIWRGAGINGNNQTLLRTMRPDSFDCFFCRIP